MKGFFGISAYYALFILTIASLGMQPTTLQKLVPDDCQSLPLEGRYVWIPNSVSQVFDESTINLHFSTIKGNQINIWGEVQNGKISPLHCGRSNNYDYEVWMSDLNAIELATSDKPITTFQNLRRQGQIRIEANGEKNQQRLDAASVLENRDNEAVPQSIQDFFGSIHTADILLFLIS